MFFNFCLFSKGALLNSWNYFQDVGIQKDSKALFSRFNTATSVFQDCDDKCFPIYLFPVCGHSCCMWLLKMDAQVQIHSTAEPHLSNHFHPSGFYLCVSIFVAKAGNTQFFLRWRNWQYILRAHQRKPVFSPYSQHIALPEL